jgi:fibro-slime domain-containing protein
MRSVRSSVWMTAVVMGAGLAMPALAGSGTSGNSGTGSNSGNSGSSGASDLAMLPRSIVLTGVARDFRGSDATGGHPDFQRQPTGGFGHYVGQVGLLLDASGKPVYASQGYKVSRSPTDSAGRSIMPIIPGENLTEVMDNQSREAVAPGTSQQTSSQLSTESVNKVRADNERRAGGSVATKTGGALTTAANFNQWFNDVPGVNTSIPVPITLVRQENSRVFTFDDKNDATYRSRSGFFPINGIGFGNSGTWDRNYHFTYELETHFVFRRGGGQVFTFTGDDDVWVFIDGRLVIDLGGVHGALSQSVNLDNLSWLEDGKSYQLKLFFAERHYTQSNMRIDTTIEMMPAELPSMTYLFD